MTDMLQSIGVLLIGITLLWHLVSDHGKGGNSGRPAQAF